LCSDPGTGPTVWIDDGEACDAAGLCNQSTGTCTCSLGQTRCNSTTYNFEECGTTGWAEIEVCTAGCDDTDGCLEEEEAEE
jgi:hypothetical protein